MILVVAGKDIIASLTDVAPTDATGLARHNQNEDPLQSALYSSKQ